MHNVDGTDKTAPPTILVHGIRKRFQATQKIQSMHTQMGQQYGRSVMEVMDQS